MKQNKCKYCDSTLHYSIQCFLKPRRPLKPISDKTLSKKQECDRAWYAANPPDSKGLWYCYLNITPECPIKLTRSTITLEHVRSKVRALELKYDITNLKPACSPCNKLKGSRDVDEL